MTRRRFGADLTSVAWSLVTADGSDDVVQLARNAGPFTAWDSRSGGAQVTDLTDPSETPLVGGEIFADADGIFEFRGPDTDPQTVELWLDAGLGVRQLIMANDIAGEAVRACDSTLTISKAGTPAGTRPTLNLIEGSNIMLSVADDAPNDRVNVTVATSAGTSGASWQDVGSVALDSFTGVDDDEKLTNALAYVAAETYPSTIRLANRQHDFLVGQREPFKGLRIMGPFGFSNPEQSKMAGKVRLAFSGGWWHITSLNKSDYASFTLANLSFQGTSTASVITQSVDAGGLQTALLRDLSCSGLKSILGTQSQVLRMTACVLDGGAWNIANCYSGAVHIAGSDNTLWPQGGLIDSGPAFATAGGSEGDYHLWFDFLDKSVMGPVFLTAESPWSGLRVDGPSDNNSTSNNQGMVSVSGAKFEGRNPDQPSAGNLIRVKGGNLLLDRCWISYGMSDPVSTGHSPQDAGVLHQEAGFVDMEGCFYDRAGTVAETVPWVYTSGGLAIVKRSRRVSKGGTWTGLPRVDQAGGTVDTDAYVTVI